ncbi:hypothetical protein [Geotalea toluenoxydans]|uniref:hypothetical protein n=1 Tax=Geotalea toluenoxydans TaxID=421624 RepID=UPI000B21544D
MLQEAISRRSELKQLDSLGSVAAANFKTARSGYLPILSGTASIGYATGVSLLETMSGELA